MSEAGGGIADEAVRLAQALEDWMRSSGAGERLADLDAHLATGAPECTVCPLCRLVAAAREAAPEVRARAAEAVAAMVVAARAVADVAEAVRAAPPADRAAGAEPRTPARETIPVDEEDAWD